MLHHIKGKLYLITKMKYIDLFPGMATATPMSWIYLAEIETGLSCPRWDYVAIDKSKRELIAYLETL